MTKWERRQPVSLKYDPKKFASPAQCRRMAKLLGRMTKEKADRIIEKYKLEVTT